MPRNFGFVLDGVLAGMERPGTHASLREDLEFLWQQGIRALVSLTEGPLDQALLAEFGFRCLHLPVADFGTPELTQIETFVAFQKQAESDGLPVAVHCGAGHGRTGTLLACALVQRGLTAAAALARLRALRPLSIETDEQEDLVRAFEEYVRRGHHGA